MVRIPYMNNNNLFCKHTYTHNVRVSFWKIKFGYLFTLVDSENREMQTPRKNKSFV
jgi:hypothetical protein